MRIPYLLVAITLLITSCSKDEQSLQKIDPPFEHVQIPRAEITIDPAIKQIARFENGTNVEIPAHAFIDQDGNVITEPVTLSLETYNSAASIIASGIPMSFDDGIESGHFESAGMFRIEGEANGKEVFIAPNKPLTVDTPSDVRGDFDFFYFEESPKGDSTGSWKKLAAMTGEPIATPAPLDTFKLKFTTATYPELAPLETITWKLARQYANPKEADNQWVLNEAWSSVEISQPKYGYGDEIFKTPVREDNNWWYDKALAFNKNQSIITLGKDKLNFWDLNGQLLNTVPFVNEYGFNIKIFDDRIILLEGRLEEKILDSQGNLLGTIDASYDHLFVPGKDLIIHRTYDYDSITISNLEGKALHFIEVRRENPKRHYDYRDKPLFIESDQHIVTNSDLGITFYDLDGQVIRQKEGWYYKVDKLKEDILLLETPKGELIAWDYKNDIETKSKIEDFRTSKIVNDDHRTLAYYYPIYNTSIVYVQEMESNISKLWDYSSNITSTLDFQVESIVHHDSTLRFINGFNIPDSTFQVYDFVNKQYIISIPGAYPSTTDESIRGNFDIKLSKEQERLILRSPSHVRLYDVQGTLLRDFKQFDSLILVAGFIDEASIYTLDSIGIYRIWDYSGNEISSVQLDHVRPEWARLYGEYLIVDDYISGGYFYYNSRGVLQSQSPTWDHIKIDSTRDLQVIDINKAVLYHLFELDKNVYQIIFRNKKRTFTTYVYLSEEDLEKIRRHHLFLRQLKIAENKQRQIEYKRQAFEDAVSRRLSISNFGLYNWDILLKEEGRVRLAAEFDFKQSTEDIDITVFLITNVNGRAVIKYPKGAWDQFSIDPTVSNKLLAVLPNNKIAVFDEADMAQLNWAQIEKDSTYRFEMKVLDKPISSVADLDELINGIKP
ncbi:MAG: hypothetical protein AAFX87_09910 [Bacteroidota bacterium]